MNFQINNKAGRWMCSVTAGTSLLLVSGCTQTGSTGVSKTVSLAPVEMSAAKAGTVAKAPAEGYWEQVHEGRIYVIGNAETHASFMKTHHLPYTFTKIGAGPKGETVVVEADKSGKVLQDKLWEKFRLRNLYYAEEEHEGRTYVLGSAVSQLGFRKSPHLPYALTMIGAGVDGKTVVFEVSKDNQAYALRLKAEYARRHNIAFAL